MRKPDRAWPARGRGEHRLLAAARFIQRCNTRAIPLAKDRQHTLADRKRPLQASRMQFSLLCLLFITSSASTSSACPNNNVTSRTGDCIKIPEFKMLNRLTCSTPGQQLPEDGSKDRCGRDDPRSRSGLRLLVFNDAVRKQRVLQRRRQMDEIHFVAFRASPQTISREEIGRVRITELCD